MQEKEVYEYLTAHGVKASVQRVAVMQYLLQQMGHPTVDEIYQALVDHIPTLSQDYRLQHPPPTHGAWRGAYAHHRRQKCNSMG